MTIVDVDNQIVGKAASVIAKRLLNGDEIIVVNAEKAVITGKKDFIFKRYKEYSDRGSVRKGPHYPKMPDRIFRRTVRGMLPVKQAKGKDAYKRLRVYIDIPEQYKNNEFEKIKDAENTKFNGFVTLKDLSKFLGAKL